MWRYILPRALTGALLVLAAVELVYGLFGPPSWWLSVADDLEIYTAATARLLTGGSWYLPHQLAGPYPLASGDVLYPPASAWFFAPWAILPFVAYLAIPIAVTAYLVVRARPSPWAWVLIALCIAWPATLLKTSSGNPNVWVMMLVALALRYGWPGALILLKPSFLPLALIGIRSRGWWVAAGVLVMLSLPFLGPTLDYPRVVLDVRGSGLGYSLWDLPMVLIPVLHHVFDEDAIRARWAVATRRARPDPRPARPA